MTATERFKRLFADAVERICVLEEQLELAQGRVDELEAADVARNGDLEQAGVP